jgi:hypothetical protein
LLSAKGKEFGVNTFSVVLILLFDACEIWQGKLHCWEECMKPPHEEDGDKWASDVCNGRKEFWKLIDVLLL